MDKKQLSLLIVMIVQALLIAFGIYKEIHDDDALWATIALVNVVFLFINVHTMQNMLNDKE